MRALVLLGCILSGAVHAANPVPSLDYKLPFDETATRYNCDVTITTGEGNWSNLTGSMASEVVCIDAGDHSGKGILDLTSMTGGSFGSDVNISAVTLNNPVQVDFASTHGWSTGDYIHCTSAVGGTWELRRRFFRVTVVDTDSVTLDNQDASGGGTRPLWTAWTSGGACRLWSPKVIRHTVDVAHPSTLADGDRAKIRSIEIGDGATEGAATDHIFLWGLSVDRDGLAGTGFQNIIRNRGGDNIVVDWSHLYNKEAVDNPQGDNVFSHIQLQDFAVFNFQVQRTVFSDTGFDDPKDSTCVNYVTSSDGAGVRVIENEFQNCGTVFQTTGSMEAEAWKFVGNSSYITKNYLSDCNGTLSYAGTNYDLAADDSAPCASWLEGDAGNKGSFSASARVTDKDSLWEMDSNLHCCRRPEDGTLGDGGSGGQILAHSGGGNERRNTLIRNGVIFDAMQGANGVFGTGAVLEYQSVVGMIMEDLQKRAGSSCCGTSGGARAFAQFNASDTTLQNVEMVFNTLLSLEDGWLDRTRNENADWRCNLKLDAAGVTGAEPTGWTQQDNYGYGNTTDLDAGDTDGGVLGNANMTDLTVNPRPYSDPSETYTISGVLSTVSSPHLSACGTIGSSGRGVSDETVTF